MPSGCADGGDGVEVMLWSRSSRLGELVVGVEMVSKPHVKLIAAICMPQSNSIALYAESLLLFRLTLKQLSKLANVTVGSHICWRKHHICPY